MSVSDALDRGLATWHDGYVPSYVHAMFAMVGVCLLAALVLPAPRMPLSLAARWCRALLTLGIGLMIGAATLPAFDVWYPAIAAIGAALGLWLAMFWLARQPDLYATPDPEAQSSDDPDDDDHGGGGGGSPPPDRGPDPPPAPDGLDWDAFDRHRRSWEQDRDRTPAGV